MECDKCRNTINRGMAGSEHKTNIIDVTADNIDEVINDIDFPKDENGFKKFLEDNKKHRDEMNGMTEQDRKDFDEAMKELHEAEIKQHEKDAAVMRDVKKLVTSERYMSVEIEIEDSEKAYNYRIVQNPIGEPYIGDHGIRGWVDQRAVGLSGDSWEGSVCVEISSHEYLMWDFEV